MILVALLACTMQLSSPPAQQEQKSAMDLAAEAHLRVVRAEREFQFFARYTFSSPEARARAASALERLKTPGSASGSTSSSIALATATRALEDPPKDASAEALREAERLQQLVGALDMQPTPAIFAAGVPTQGQLLRVVVYPIHPPAERFDATLSLWWTQPDGVERLAWRGPAAASLFENAGFSVEVAAPGSSAGLWYLVLGLERRGVSVRGDGLELQCVPRLVERSQAAFAELADPQDPRQCLARWITLASQRGMRTLALLDCDAQLARWDGKPRAFEPYAWQLAFQDDDEDPHWIWRLDPASEPRATLVLLTPSNEPPEAQLARPEWRDLARIDRMRLLAVHLPRNAVGPNSVASLFERLAQAGEGSPLVCVARGDAIGRLAMGFHGREARPYAAEVLASSDRPADPAALGGPVPRLVLAPGGRAACSEAKLGDALWWLDGPAIELLSTFELPTRLRGALGELSAQLLPPPRESK